MRNLCYIFLYKFYELEKKKRGDNYGKSKNSICM